jgi:hypothetical protein
LLDGCLITLGTSTLWSLYAPADLVQDKSYTTHLAWVVPHSKHAFNHHSYTFARPHISLEAKGWCSKFE